MATKIMEGEKMKKKFKTTANEVAHLANMDIKKMKLKISALRFALICTMIAAVVSIGFAWNAAHYAISAQAEFAHTIAQDISEAKGRE